MNEIDLSPEASVRRGALYLFHLDPDWIDHIDLDRLDMHDGADCALGQFAGEGRRYSDAIADLRDRIESGHYGPEMVLAHAALVDEANRDPISAFYAEDEVRSFAAGILFGFQVLDSERVGELLQPIWVALVEAERLPLADSERLP